MEVSSGDIGCSRKNSKHRKCLYTSVIFPGLLRYENELLGSIPKPLNQRKRGVAYCKPKQKYSGLSLADRGRKRADSSEDGTGRNR